MEYSKAYQQKPKEELIQILLAMKLQEEKMKLQEEKAHAEKGKTDATIADKQNTITELRQQVNILTEAIKLAKLRHYGPKSEKYSPDQLSIFDEPGMPENVSEIESADEDIQIPAHSRKKKAGRKGLPKDMLRIEEVYDLPEAEKVCSCGCMLDYIGEARTEQLELIPAKEYIIVHVQKKYACQECGDTVKCATKPPQPIPKSIAGPTLLASILTNKYEYHLPLYRQEKMIWM